MEERKVMFKNVGLFLKEKREKRGLSQTEVAEVLNVKSQFISNWEHGRSSPPLKYLRLVMKIYGIPEDEMLGFMLAEQEKMLRSMLKINRRRG